MRGFFAVLVFLAVASLGFLDWGGGPEVSSSDYFYQQHLAGLHSHNDQEQTNPLTDALALGYESIEVDVFLVAGEVLVGHTLGDTSPGVTLSSVYLAPLAALPVDEHPAVLAVDLKTSPSAALFTAVVAAVASFPVFDDGHMRIVITGTQPVAPSVHPAHVVFGRSRSPANIADPEVAVLETNFTSFSSWNGIGPVPLDVRETFVILANEAHKAGKQARIYFAPATAASWQAQFDAGLDWIQPGGQHPPGADDIAGLAAWLAAL